VTITATGLPGRPISGTPPTWPSATAVPADRQPPEMEGASRSMAGFDVILLAGRDTAESQSNHVGARGGEGVGEGRLASGRMPKSLTTQPRR